MTLTAVRPALDGIGSPVGEPDALRRLAWALDAVSERHARAAEDLRLVVERLAGAWSGDAATAALDAVADLSGTAGSAAEAHASAAEVLRRCAGRLDDVQATWERARALERQDAVRRVTGAPDDDLRAQARRLAHQAVALDTSAQLQAAIALEDLADAAPRTGLDLSDQLRGVATGAWDAVAGSAELLARLSVPRLVLDRDGWLDDVLSLRDATRHAKDHPHGAAEAVLGLDQLRAGAYGEWLGGLLPDLLGGVASGGALPAGRRALDAASDLSRLSGRVPDTGGPVELRDGADVPAGYVTHVADLTPARRRHILDGDRKGGGHRSGTGRRGKTEFPPSWPDDDIIRVVMATATRPSEVVWSNQHGRWNATAEHDGVTVLVSVDPKGNVVTAYPLEGGPGVVMNQW